MKLRSPGGVLNSWRIRYFGGIANVTAWPDVPLAMSQGTFDGLITTNESANSSKLFNSGLRHSLQDHQAMGLYIPIVNQAFWKKLGPELQGTMTKLWADNITGYRANTAKSQENGRAELIKQGVAFVDVPQAELDAMHKKMLDGAGQGRRRRAYLAEAGPAGHGGCRRLTAPVGGSASPASSRRGTGSSGSWWVCSARRR